MKLTPFLYLTLMSVQAFSQLGADRVALEKKLGVSIRSVIGDGFPDETLNYSSGSYKIQAMLVNGKCTGLVFSKSNSFVFAPQEIGSLLQTASAEPWNAKPELGNGVQVTQDGRAVAWPRSPLIELVVMDASYNLRHVLADKLRLQSMESGWTVSQVSRDGLMIRGPTIKGLNNRGFIDRVYFLSNPPAGEWVDGQSLGKHKLYCVGAFSYTAADSSLRTIDRLMIGLRESVDYVIKKEVKPQLVAPAAPAVKPWNPSRPHRISAGGVLKD